MFSPVQQYTPNSLRLVFLPQTSEWTRYITRTGPEGDQKTKKAS